MVENLSRTKNLPELSQLLGRTEPQKEQSSEEQQAFFDALAAQWGVKG